MPSLTLTRRCALAAAVLGAAAVAIFASMLISVRDYHDASSGAARSELVIAAARALEGDVSAMERGLRGAMITGDVTYLDVFGAARGRSFDRAQELLALLDDERQRRAGQEVRREVERYVEQQADPLAVALRTVGHVAAASRETDEGHRRIAAVSARVGSLVAAEQQRREERRARAERNGDRTVAVAGGGLAAICVLIALLFGYVVRSVVRPVQAVARGARELANGHRHTWLAERGDGEVVDLARAFNGLSASLQRADENMEAQNEELQAQQAELEGTVSLLAQKKDRLDVLHRFGQMLTARADLDELAPALLTWVVDEAGPDLAALYVASGDGTLELASTVGFDPAELAPAVRPNVGLAGRAAAEQRVLRAAHGEGELRVRTLGAEVALRDELHVPLVHSGRTVGLVSVAFVGTHRPAESAVELLDSLAGQAAVAIANGLSFRRATQEARTNQVVLDATPAPIALCDVAGRVVIANRAMQALIDTLDGGDESTLTVVPDDVDLESERRDELVLEGSGRVFARVVGPVANGDGSAGRIVVMSEVTAEREVERIKEEFFALVSHELRTPLTSIIGYLELLLEDGAGGIPGEQDRHFLRVMDRNARRLLRLVGDLLYTASMTAGTSTLYPAEADLRAIVAEAVESAMPRAEGHGIDLELAAGAPVACAVDRERVAQVLDNLLSNAIKYTPSGGSVTVRVSTEGEHAAIEVADTGIGISDDELARLFRPFVRSANAAALGIQGVGLGLVIVRSIVEGHGGRVEVRSTEGVGTSVLVTLPLASPLAGPGAGRTAPTEVADDLAAAA
jgi:signal transduction histidine kinase/CHASE3 domain sensor protein